MEHLTAWKFIRQDEWGGGVDVRVGPQADGSLQKGGKWKILIYIVLPPQWRNGLFLWIILVKRAVTCHKQLMHCWFIFGTVSCAQPCICSLYRDFARPI